MSSFSIIEEKDQKSFVFKQTKRKTLNFCVFLCEIPFFLGSEESRLFAESVMYVSRGFFTSVIKRVFVSLPLAIYIKFLTYSHFTHFFFFFAF